MTLGICLLIVDPTLAANFSDWDTLVFNDPGYDYLISYQLTLFIYLFIYFFNFILFLNFT